MDGLIEKSGYNRRRRRLFPYLEELRKKLAVKMNGAQRYFIVDSMPLETCKNARMSRSKIFKGKEGAFPNQGSVPHRTQGIMGTSFMRSCSIDGVFDNFNLSPVSVHHIHYLKDIKSQIPDCVILGDEGYLSSAVQINLFEAGNIKLETPLSANQKNYKSYPFIFKNREKESRLYSPSCVISL